MKLVIILFAIYAFLESSSYAVYEYKKNKIRSCKYYYTCKLRTCTPYIQYIIINRMLLVIIDQEYNNQFYLHNMYIF